MVPASSTSTEQRSVVPQSSEGDWQLLLLHQQFDPRGFQGEKHHNTSREIPVTYLTKREVRKTNRLKNGRLVGDICWLYREGLNHPLKKETCSNHLPSRSHQ